MHKRFMITAIALAAATTLLVGCSSSSSKSGSSGSSTPPGGASTGGGASSSAEPTWLTDAKTAAAKAAQIPTTVPSSDLGAVTVKKGATIYHVACNLALAGCSNLANAMKAAAAAAGVNFKICDGGTTADKITSCFTNAVNAKPDVIITNGIGADIAGNGYAAAAKAKIPVVGSFTGNAPGVAGVATEVAGDACTAEGKTLAQYAIADSNGKANALFVGTKTYACNQQRQAGFEAGMKECTTCSEKTIQFAIDAIQTTLPSQIASALTANPNVNYVVGTFDAIALTATDQIRQAGKTNIKVLGFDADAPNVALVGKGDIQVADVTTGSEDAGWAAVDAALRVIAGKKLPNVLPVTTVLITKDNVAQIGKTFKGATGYQDAFKKLWGVS